MTLAARGLRELRELEIAGDVELEHELTVRLRRGELVGADRRWPVLERGEWRDRGRRAGDVAELPFLEVDVDELELAALDRADAALARPRRRSAPPAGSPAYSVETALGALTGLVLLRLVLARSDRVGKLLEGQATAVLELVAGGGSG
jgi:hypothetical protein